MTTENQDTPQTGLRSVHAGLNYRTSADNFERTIAELPEDQQETLRWWYFHGKENNLSLAKLAGLAGISSSTFSLIFAGKYNAGLDKMCDSLAKARMTLSERVENPDFIMTALAKRMFAVFDRARALQTVSILWGVMGVGKTVVAKEYRRRNNHGRTIYIRCGAGMAFGQFVNHLAKAMGVTSKNRGQHEIRDKIISLLRAGQRLLIVDELHQIFLTTRTDTAVKIAEFLRECHDESDCGLVLIGTEVVKRELFTGAHKEALEQLVDRGTLQIPLPPKPTKQDIRAFFSHFNLQEPGENHADARRIVSDILTTSGLRKLTLHLKDGKAAATKAGETYHWGHFVQAFEDLQSLSK
ncbi:AAA family ATPase [Luteolibacter marinus]|uniref:AAA family ATPase n=1 Tax=Luteolibacter marinus TaxID=2776705 RepID=UPI0018696037|nr:AAA family ATPase [Luteolibacter marinus]